MTVFSGVQPSGNVTIGNYFGAMKNWVSLQKDNVGDCIYSVVDLHSITVKQDPAVLKESTLDALALCVAMGVDHEVNTLFVQSHVQQHTELWWMLNQFVPFGELSRMTQFKDKSASSNPDEVMAGLFNYPVLMAADILLYKANLVAVGDDQDQHLQLARHIVKKLNTHLSKVRGGVSFPSPLVYKSDAGGRIMALQEPNRKMSKSDANHASYISVLDDSDAIFSKIWSANTDASLKDFVGDSMNDAGVCNLVSIGKCLWGSDVPLDGISVRALKQDLIEGLVSELSPIQDEFRRLRYDMATMDGIMRIGADKASCVAATHLDALKRGLGIVVL